MNTSLLGIASSLLLGLHASVLMAAGSATIETGSSTQRSQVQVEYREGKLRMDTKVGGQQQGTMIVRDGKVYAVHDKMVMDLTEMMGMLGQKGMAAPSNGPDDMARYLGLDSTGRRETIAGASGSVHVLRYQDSAGKTHSDEIVLSSDPRARELGEAMQLMSNAFRRAVGKAETAGEAQLASQLKGQGALRYGKAFRVVKFGDGEPAASRFELPAAPQRLPGRS